MPGPFDSSKNKGTFDKDVSTIKQNDIWSSATFNNFVRSVYDVFYRESAYSRVFGNWDKPRLLRGRISSDSETAETPKGCAFGEATYLFHNVVIDEGAGTGRVECYPVYHGISPEDAWKWVSHDMSYHDSHGDYDTCAVRFEDEEKLFCGRGDVSLHVKPYALFPVKDSSNTNQAYCCITYEEGDPAGDTSTVQSGQVITPRYSSIAEITFIYDPARPSDAGISFAKGFPVRTVINHETQDMSDVNLKLTVTFGADSAFAEFLQRINTDELVTGKIFNAVAVGDPDTNQTLLQAVFNTDTSPDIMTKTIRFVPVRPCIDILSSGKTLRMLTVIPDPLNGTVPDPSQVSIGAYKDNGDGKVFKYPGVYGFIIDNRLSAAAVQTGCRLVYIPNRTAADHYVPADSTVTTPLLPDWYNDILSKVDGVSTEDFSEEFFFVPFLTVNERTLEIGDYSISLDTILAYGNIIGGVDTGQQQALLESTVVYDASTFTNTDPSVVKPANKRLVEEADKVFGSMVDLFKQDSQGEHRSDTLTSNTQVSALERTLQFLIGLNWKLSDVIFIDPLLGVCTETEAPQSGDPARKYKNTAIDRSRKMYGSINQVIRDEVDGEFGRGSLIHPGTIFVHVTDPATDQPAYSNDPTDVNWQPLASDEDFRPVRRNIWREVYAEYLPGDVRHIAVRALSDKTVTDPDFEGFDIDYGYSVLYLRLLQDPNLTDFSSPGWENNWYLPSPAASGDSRGLNHLMCKSALKFDIQRNPKDIDVNSDYYPISGQDFTQTHHTIVEDIFAGARIPNKIPDNKVRLDGIKAGRFTYIPREVVYKDIISYGSSWSHDPESPWVFESLTIGAVTLSTSDTWGYGENHLLQPSGSPDDWRYDGWYDRGKLDWLGFNHEVIVNTNCEISSMYQCIDLRVPVNKTGTTPDTGLRIWGSCISFLNSNAAIRNLYVKKGGLPFSDDPGIRTLNVPGAGQLMLFKQSEDTSCEAEVSAMQFVGKGGGVQTVVFTPVAWPFAALWGDPHYLLGSKFGVAYSYSIIKTGNQYKFGASNQVREYLCNLSMNNSRYYLEGGRLDLTFNFEDRRVIQDTLAEFDYETRDKSLLHTVISVTGRVRNCDIFLRITDHYNVYPWVSPDKDWMPAGKITVYPAGTWQAFDPDIFLGGNSPEVTLVDTPAGTFPDTFTFIDCGMNNDWITGYLTECRFTVALYDDAVYQEPWRWAFDNVGGDLKPCDKQPYYRLNRMFFSSRMFRQSPYIFYFGSSSLKYFTDPCDGTDYVPNIMRGIASTGVDFSIVAGSVGWDSETKTVNSGSSSTKTRVCIGPLNTTESGHSDYLPQQGSFAFVFGLANSTVQLDELYIIPAVKHEVRESTHLLPKRRHAFCALFSAVSDSLITINHLDTTLRYVDEWYYLPEECYVNPLQLAYPMGVSGEPENGFVFFMAPSKLGSESFIVPKVNRNNRLNIGLWTTRQTISGIYGLDNSEVNINYSFEDQADLCELAVGSNTLDVSEIDPPAAYAQIHRPMSIDVSDLFNLFTLRRKIESGKTNYSLPSLPLFYVANVHNCEINLMLAQDSRGTPNTFLLYKDENTLDTGQEISSRLRERKMWLTQYMKPQYDLSYSTAFPHFGTGNQYPVPQERYDNTRRALRLAVGYVIIWAKTSVFADQAYEIAPACGNTIHGLFTRANLVNGIFNSVSGWCFELLATGSTDYTPDAWYHEGDPASAISKTRLHDFGSLLAEDNQYAQVVRRYKTLDTHVYDPGDNGGDPDDDDVLIAQRLSLMDPIDVPIGSPDQIDREGCGTLSAHIKEVDLDYLAPRSQKNSGALYAQAWDLSGRYASTTQGNISQRATESYHGSHIFVTDAYNTANLMTILVATSTIRYCPSGVTIYDEAPEVRGGYAIHTTYYVDRVDWNI